MLLACVPVFANDAKDSLYTLISESFGTKKIEARLELAFMTRVNDFTVSYEQASLAYEEARRRNLPPLEAKGAYYLGMAYYYHSDFDSAMQYFLLSESIAKTLQDHKLLGYLYQLIGTCYNTYYGDQALALDYYNQSIRYALLSQNYRTLGATYSAISNMLRVNGSYEKALEFIHRSRDSYLKANFTEGAAWIRYMTGILHNSVKLYDEALAEFEAALALYRKLVVPESGNYTGVAICLDQIAAVQTKKGNYTEARELNREALELHRLGQSRFGLSTSLKYLAEIEYRAGNYDLALAHLDSSMILKKSMNDILGLTGMYELLGLIYLAQEKYAPALDILQTGLESAVRNHQVQYIMDINRHLSRAHQALGNYEKAYYYQSDQIMAADSIYNSRVTRNMVQLETLFEIESRDKTIRELQQENRIQEMSLEREKTLRSYMTGFIILSLMMIAMFIYFSIERRRAHTVLMKSKALVDEINASKDKLFSIIAHDLRGPFNSILGLTDLLKDNFKAYGPEKLERMINAIYSSAHNSFALLNNLLEWSRTQTGMIQFSPAPISLDESVGEVLALLSSQAEHKKIRLDYTPSQRQVCADRNMLHTILRNLISNAVKYSRPDDSIVIDSREEDGMIRISVRDTGIGIPEEARRRLFNLADGYQITGTAGEKGTGLGLMICKEFVEKHGGSIGVDSEPGKGSTFYFTMKKDC